MFYDLPAWALDRFLVRAAIANGIAANFGPLPNNQPQFTVPAGGRFPARTLMTSLGTPSSTMSFF